MPGVDGDRVRRLRREEYERLVDAGVFGDERVELVRGVIVRMPPQGPLHSGPIEILNEILLPKLLGRARVRVQLPLIAPDDSVPEPDLAIVPLGISPHREHPRSAHLVIEVAHTTRSYDRGTKVPLYAEMGVPEVWIVDVGRRAIEVYRDPEGEQYRTVSTVTSGVLATLAFPDVTIDVAAVLGPA